MPSADETNRQTPRPAPLLAAGMMLAERGIYGMIWVDEKLEITARYGRLVSFAEIGEPVTLALLPLMGLEAEIRDLKASDGQVIEIPDVAIVGKDGSTPKVNISVFWSKDEGCFLVVLTRFSQRTDLEVELSRQIRARLMAEAEVMQTSKELAKTNAELGRANRDLEEFASIISHDLKAPMRHLRYIVDEIEASASDQLPEAALSKLEDLKDQARRMASMLTSLLEYSSAGRKEETAEEVDTHGLVHAITSSMRPPPGFEIEIAGFWPTIATVVAPLDLVLRNLIDNAIKHHDRAEGLVRLTCSDQGEALLITVEDDGPGIPSERHEAAFQPFRRLKPGRTDGQGMGLAFVRRWVGAAGGRLSLESDPAKRRGTTFRLVWPKLRRN